MRRDTPPLRIALLTSGSAPGLARLIADANRGVLFDIACVIAVGSQSAQLAFAEANEIPVETLSVEGEPRRRNPLIHRERDDRIASIAASHGADWIILCGYDATVSAPLLDAFPSRVLALHDGDLLRFDAEGRRAYAGPHAVREAIAAGEVETRSSMYLATGSPGEGPIVLLSEPFPVGALAVDARATGNAALLFDYASLHRRWMVERAWPDLLVHAIDFLVAGRLEIVGDIVWIDGVPGPCRLGDAPAICRRVETTIRRGVPASCPLVRGA